MGHYVTFFSTTFCFSVIFKIKRKNSKNHIFNEKHRKKILFCGKKRNFIQGVKAYKKFGSTMAMGGGFSNNLSKFWA